MDDPTSFLVFSVLGPDEQEYAQMLKGDIVKARPEFDNILPVWSDERTIVREAMSKTKLESLLYARENEVGSLVS